MPRKHVPILVQLRVSDTSSPDTRECTSEEETPKSPIKEDSPDGLFILNRDHIKVTKYPNQSRTVCWWDGASFTGVPSFIPRTSIGKTYTVYGNFCSPACAMAYLKSERKLDSDTIWERNVLLHDLTAEVFGKVEDIIPAPPREMLFEYGGPYSIDKYRKLIGSDDYTVEISCPPLVIDIPEMQVKKMSNTVTRSALSIIDNARFKQAAKNVKVSGSKKLKSSLASIMNIRIVPTS